MKRYLEMAGGRRSALPADNNRVMMISPELVLYFGLIGETTPRSLGSLTIYLSFCEPFRFRTECGCWEDRHAAVVAPYLEHQIIAHDRVGMLLIEPETIDMAHVQRAGEVDGSADLAVVVDSLMNFMHRRSDALHEQDEQSIAEIRDTALGGQLQRRHLDPRIGAIVAMIRDQPWERFSAESCALVCGLSVSRFLHLFKSELGVAFRRFVAWKRARCALEYVKHRASLTDIALELGYPDSSHFSHSIRKTYGFSPRTMFFASRHLSLCMASIVGEPERTAANSHAACDEHARVCA
ncbi:MAG: helix-turn-helix transcriptional regulator [Cupriavidus sp.]|nr:helix-turn-helix transcriptional regulator [Cupriavidus sp.]